MESMINENKLYLRINLTTEVRKQQKYGNNRSTNLTTEVTTEVQN